jgi:hypothetical protein
MQPVDCPEHGASPACIICQHLRTQDGLGYYAIAAEPAEPAMAWCEACDQLLAQERGWTDRADAHAGWKLLCTRCHERRLAAHQLINWLEGTRTDEG